MSKSAADVLDADVDVTVIVANYNGEKYVADALRSLTNQSLRDIEILVSDDASTDSSVQIIRSLMADDARIRIIESKVNTGPAAARNRALEVARGRWIAIMDSDDLMHPDRLQALVEVGAESGADIVADDLLLFDTDRRAPPRTLFSGRWASSERWIRAEDYLKLNNPYGRGPALGYLKPIVRASFVSRYAVRYDERLRIAEDFNFVFRLLMAGAKFRTTPRIGYFYRRHSGSLSHRLEPSVLAGILDVERGWAERYPAIGAGLFRSRARSIDRALAFEKLVQAIKARQIAACASIAVSNPAALLFLRLPVRKFVARLLPRPRPAKHERRQICIFTRQRIVGRTNGSSRYLLDIADYLVTRGFDVHLLVPSPVTLGRWPVVKLSKDMLSFKTIRFRGTLRIGSYIIGLDPRIAIRGLLGALDLILYRAGIISRQFFRPAPYAVAQQLTREDQMFIAKQAPAVAEIQIADYCFLTEAYPYALRPDARRVVVMHDLFSSRAAQFSRLYASDSVVSLPLEDEVRMLGRAETIIAIQWDEAAVLQRKLPRHEILVAPLAALPVGEPQTGNSEIVLFVGSSAAPNVDGIRWFIDACWPLVRERRPNAVLYIAGTVCNALGVAPPRTKLLNVVEELDALYHDAAVVISPLRAGSGLKIKLIEGLSKGKAMAVTTTTMQGVTDILSGCTLVDDSDLGFASNVADLLGDADRRAELGAKGIAAISRHFSPEHSYGAMVSALEAKSVGPSRKVNSQ